MKSVKKIKLKINEECKQYLEFSSERCRLIYNFALKDRIDYYEQNKKSISIYELKKKLPEIKIKYPEYNKVYNKCLTAMYFRLDASYNLFFKKFNKFPKYKRKSEFISQEYPAQYIKIIDTNRFLLPTGKDFKNKLICRTKESIPKEFTTLTIKKNKDNYFACFTVEVEEITNNSKESLSIDLGIKNLVTGITTDNKLIKVKKFSYNIKHLDLLRSRRDKCKKNSIRHKKWDRIFQRQLTLYKNRIKDYLHKVTNWLTKKLNYNLIIGKLDLQNMKTEKAWINRILLNEWRISEFVEMLKYKSIKFGKQLTEIDESYTSKTCFKCGRIKHVLL